MAVSRGVPYPQRIEDDFARRLVRRLADRALASYRAHVLPLLERGDLQAAAVATETVQAETSDAYPDEAVQLQGLTVALGADPIEVGHGAQLAPQAVVGRVVEHRPVGLDPEATQRAAVPLCTCVARVTGVARIDAQVASRPRLERAAPKS